MALRVGVAGVCGFGRYHAGAFEEVGCEVVAVADLADEVERWAERFSGTVNLTSNRIGSGRKSLLPLLLP